MSGFEDGGSASAEQHLNQDTGFEDQGAEAGLEVQSIPNLSLQESAKFMQSLEAASEGTRQLYELRAEERRLRTTLCRMVSYILSFLDTSIPVTPTLLDTPAYRVKDAYLSSDGVLYMTLSSEEKKLRRLSELEGETILKVVDDVMPNITRKIEADAHSLNELIAVMDRAVKELEKSQPALANSSNRDESEAEDLVRKTLNA